MPFLSDSDQLEQAILERIRQLGLGTDPDFLLELIDSYAPLFKKLQGSIIDSLEKGNRDTLHYAAHSLKSASLNIGASGLAAVARTIEEFSQHAEFGTMEPFLSELDLRAKKTYDALVSIKSRLSQQKSST